MATGNRRIPQSSSKEIISFLKTISVLIILAVIFRASIVEAFKIPSGSMIPTLRISDHILVSKFSYGFRLPFMTNTIVDWAQPKRGDVVVFTRPDEPDTLEDESAMNIIKRVIGLPGDKIEVHGSKVFINDQYYPEPYARWVHGGDGDWGPYNVPAAHVLLLGDNRDESKDSRYWSVPYLDMKRIKGRALVIYWTWDPDFFSRVFKVIR